MDFFSVISHYKSVRRAADKLGYSLSAIYGWKRSGIPHPAQKHVELDTGGALKADDELPIRNHNPRIRSAASADAGA